MSKVTDASRQHVTVDPFRQSIPDEICLVRSFRSPDPALVIIQVLPLCQKLTRCALQDEEDVREQLRPAKVDSQKSKLLSPTCYASNSHKPSYYLLLRRSHAWQSNP